jgi:hypothetical protein
MASGKSQYFSQKLLNLYFGGTAYSAPATLYFALYTVTPTAAGGGTEATNSGAYARVAVTCNTTNWPAISGSSQTITNGAAITFTTATADWSSGSNMVAAGILDSGTYGGGNLIYFGALTENKPVLNGDTAQFAVNAVTVQEV